MVTCYQQLARQQNTKTGGVEMKCDCRIKMTYITETHYMPCRNDATVLISSDTQKLFVCDAHLQTMKSLNQLQDCKIEILPEPPEVEK